jgi:acid phosphatase
MILTWDEDDGTENNQIPTIFVGQMVKTGQYSETINHYTVLSTVEAMYGLKQLGNSKGVDPITDVWQ